MVREQWQWEQQVQAPVIFAGDMCPSRDFDTILSFILRSSFSYVIHSFCSRLNATQQQWQQQPAVLFASMLDTADGLKHG